MKRTIPFILILMLTLSLAGCGEQSAGGGLRVWLDVPLSGLTLPVNEQVKIEGHASSSAGVARIEISINGSSWQVLESPACQNKLCSFSAVWQPDQAGVYTLQVVAVDVNGEASGPDEATLTIGGTEPPAATPPTPTQTPSPEISITPILTPTSTSTLTATPTFTPTITLTAQLIPQIQFWAEPAGVAAGKCTAIKWNAVNVKKVQFGGIDQPFSGADEECPCVDKTYTLTVTLLDNTVVERTTSVDVSGTCTTPKPPDTTPPPVPSLQVPVDGLSITCKASQTLAWLPVTDPSGIQEYQVRIQRSSDNINWSNHPASPITGLTDKTTNISVECGWYYRWSVRAIDGAGNTSDWSGWFDFVINLS